MKDFVSDRWISVVALLASMSIVWISYVPYSFPWAGLAFVSLLAGLVVSTARLGMKPARSIAQVIDDVEAEPMPVHVTSERPVVPPWQSLE